MPTLKSALGVIALLVPVVYCGWLINYFLDLTGSIEAAKTNGLGPTLLGLTVVGGLFAIPLLIKIARIFTAPFSGGGDSGGPPDDDGFDADAAIARYRAQRSTDDAPRSPSSTRSGPAKSFGRKIG